MKRNIHSRYEQIAKMCFFPGSKAILSKKQVLLKQCSVSVSLGRKTQLTAFVLPKDKVVQQLSQGIDKTEEVVKEAVGKSYFDPSKKIQQPAAGEDNMVRIEFQDGQYRRAGKELKKVT